MIEFSPFPPKVTRGELIEFSPFPPKVTRGELIEFSPFPPKVTRGELIEFSPFSPKGAREELIKFSPSPPWGEGGAQRRVRGSLSLYSEKLNKRGFVYKPEGPRITSMNHNLQPLHDAAVRGSFTQGNAQLAIFNRKLLSALAAAEIVLGKRGLCASRAA